MVLVDDGQIDCFEENGVVRVVLVDVFSDFYELVDSLDLTIYGAQKFLIANWGRE